MTKVALFNHSSNPDIEEVARIIKDHVGVDYFVKLDVGSGASVVQQDPTIQICIFHQTPDYWKWAEFESQGALDRDHSMIICMISSSPSEPKLVAMRGKSAIHYLFTVPSLSAAGLLNSGNQEMKNAWAKFLDALQSNPFSLQNDDAIVVSDKLSWFLNPDPCALLAFRLLCEAKKECGELPTKIFGDITINAPRSLSHWLAPFGKEQEDEEKAIDAVATMVSRGAKELKSKAKAVLDATKAKGEEAIQMAIKDFLAEAVKAP